MYKNNLKSSTPKFEPVQPNALLAIDVSKHYVKYYVTNQYHLEHCSRYPKAYKYYGWQ